MDVPVTTDERQKDCHPHTHGAHRGWSPVPPRKGEHTPPVQYLVAHASSLLVLAKLKQVMGLWSHKSLLTHSHVHEGYEPWPEPGRITE